MRAPSCPLGDVGKDDRAGVAPFQRAPTLSDAASTRFATATPTEVDMSGTENGKPPHWRRSRGAWARSGLNAIRGCERTRPAMTFETVGGWRGGRPWHLAMVFSSMATIAACSEDTPHPAGAGQLAGQVVVSGPLRGAKVSVDQLDYGV